MRTLLRHFIAILLFIFVCKVAVQAQAAAPRNSVPKALLLASLAPQEGIPSGHIDTRRIIAKIRESN